MPPFVLAARCALQPNITAHNAARCELTCLHLCLPRAVRSSQISPRTTQRDASLLASICACRALCAPAKYHRAQRSATRAYLPPFVLAARCALQPNIIAHNAARRELTCLHLCSPRAVRSSQISPRTTQRDASLLASICACRALCAPAKYHRAQRSATRAYLPPFVLAARCALQPNITAHNAARCELTCLHLCCRALCAPAKYHRAQRSATRAYLPPFVLAARCALQPNITAHNPARRELTCLHLCSPALCAPAYNRLKHPCQYQTHTKSTRSVTPITAAAPLRTFWVAIHTMDPCPWTTSCGPS